MEIAKHLPAPRKPKDVDDKSAWLVGSGLATLCQGESANTGNRFHLSDGAALELMRLSFTPDEELYDKTIDDVLDDRKLTEMKLPLHLKLPCEWVWISWREPPFWSCCTAAN